MKVTIGSISLEKSTSNTPDKLNTAGGIIYSPYCNFGPFYGIMFLKRRDIMGILAAILSSAIIACLVGYFIRNQLIKNIIIIMLFLTLVVYIFNNATLFL